MSTQRKTYGNPTRAKPSEEPSSATYQFRPWSQLKEVQKKTCASSGATIIREDDTDPSEEEDAIMEFVKDVSSILVCVGLSQAVAYPLGLDGSAALAMVVQFVVWAPSAWIRNERFFDFTGMATFILLATRSQAICKRRFFGDDGRWWGFFKEAPRHTIATALVLIWTLRFKHVRGRPIRFLLYFSVQGMWVFLTPLPMFALHNLDPKGDGDMGALNAGDVVGLAVWIAGFALEVIADNQKKSFKMNPANKGKFIDVGLWARCRHPNYLGEMVTWAGFFLLCRRGLLQGSGWAILAGPAFVVTVILFLSTPMLEEGADRKFGGQAAYQEYKRRAPCLLFRIW